MKSLSNSDIVARSVQSTLGEGFANSYFYKPKFDYPKTPRSYGLAYSEVTFSTTDRNALYGWFIPSSKGVAKSKYTVIYSNGNTGTMSHHVSRVKWLVKSGFNVMMYDYRGYGKSTGDITTKGLIDDTSSAIKYTNRRADIRHTKLISYGHSLGGAKSIVAVASQPQPKRLVAVVNESSFASYKDMARKEGGLTGQRLANDQYGPKYWINEIKIPVYIIHGTADTLIPVQQARILKKTADHKPNIHYWEIKGGTHFNCLKLNKGKAKADLRKIIKRL